jgi:hypothetical protein
MRRRILAMVACMLAVPSVAMAAEEPAWSPVGSDYARPLDQSQGLATVDRPDGSFTRYTGIGTVAPHLAVQGWNHVGDPGSAQGYYVEPYERDGRGGKLFRVQAPDGSWADYTHALEPWEMRNNSFSAVSPDARWMVAGEWDLSDRLLVFPMPGTAFTEPGENLPYAFAIRLDRPFRNVQGCDFVSPTRLLCASDDPSDELFGTTKPLLQLDLAAPLDGADVPATVTSHGQLPLESMCDGEFETEGIDYDERDGTLRVVMLSPGICVALDSKTWRFHQN